MLPTRDADEEREELLQLLAATELLKLQRMPFPQVVFSPSGRCFRIWSMESVEEMQEGRC